MQPRRLLDWLVVLIAIHSLAVGALLALLPRWSAAFGGWGEASPLFFIRQAGVFHLVVAAGYLLEYRRHGTVGLLLMAKSVAVVFLLTYTLAGNAPWAVPLSAAGDAAMALVVAWAYRANRTELGDS